MAFREDSTGTYTFPENSTGSTVDLGAYNTYRYINATNVYNKGKEDGKIIVVPRGKVLTWGPSAEGGYFSQADVDTAYPINTMKKISYLNNVMGNPYDFTTIYLRWTKVTGVNCTNFTQTVITDHQSNYWSTYDIDPTLYDYISITGRNNNNQEYFRQ